MSSSSLTTGNIFHRFERITAFARLRNRSRGFKVFHLDVKKRLVTLTTSKNDSYTKSNFENCSNQQKLPGEPLTKSVHTVINKFSTSFKQHTSQIMLHFSTLKFN